MTQDTQHLPSHSPSAALDEAELETKRYEAARDAFRTQWVKMMDDLFREDGPTLTQTLALNVQGKSRTLTLEWKPSKGRGVDLSIQARGGKKHTASVVFSTLNKQPLYAFVYVKPGGGVRSADTPKPYTWTLSKKPTLHDDTLDLNPASQVSRQNTDARFAHLLRTWFSPRGKENTTSELLKPGVRISYTDGQGPSKSTFAERRPEYNPKLKNAACGLVFPDTAMILQEGQDPTKEESWLLHTTPEEWRDLACWVAFFAVLTVHYQSDPVKDDHTENDAAPTLWPFAERLLPPLDAYVPARPIDLDPASLEQSLQAHKPTPLHFPWHVIEAACASLNAGKSVIFTGPPGCGKSKLAQHVAMMATDQPPVLVTASPAWTSGELMGRYLPRQDGRGLRFAPGHLLRAIEDHRWLMIDEFNRADIDGCFGELFSLLAGDTVELPYEEPLQDQGGDEADASPAEASSNRAAPMGTVRVVPEGREVVAGYRNYTMSAAFRIVATMNDADRSGLSRLSYALQRRFDIIPVEAPASGVLKEVIEQGIARQVSELQLDKNGWVVANCSGKGTFTPKAQTQDKGAVRLDLAGENIITLFSNPTPNNGFHNLIQDKVVGVATALDVVRFTAEGLRRREQEVIHWGEGGNNGHWRSEVAKQVALSYVALGVVLSVYPQLEALDDAGHQDRLAQAVRFIFKTLTGDPGGKEEAPVPCWRVVRPDSGGTPFQLEQEGTLAEFLWRELVKRFPHQEQVLLATLREHGLLETGTPEQA